VTNRQFKVFVDAGGYRDRRYWRHEFRHGGRVLAWHEVMALLVDRTGRTGPSTWEGGGYREGTGDFPVAGVSWYEAAAYADFVGKGLPTLEHWRAATGGFNLAAWFRTLAGLSNFGGHGPVPVGSTNAISTYGAYDMAGNVREWCWNCIGARALHAWRSQERPNVHV
jgi:formylglycine-generating enzyme required for sulfatase activity